MYRNCDVASNGQPSNCANLFLTATKSETFEDFFFLEYICIH